MQERNGIGSFDANVNSLRLCQDEEAVCFSDTALYIETLLDVYSSVNTRLIVNSNTAYYEIKPCFNIWYLKHGFIGYCYPLIIIFAAGWGNGLSGGVQELNPSLKDFYLSTERSLILRRKGC